MNAQLKKNFVRPSLPIGFSLLTLAILLCGLSQATEAQPRAQAVEMPPNLLEQLVGVPICEQGKNRTPNPGFEQDIEAPYGQPDDWQEEGLCTFSYGDPGPDSDVAARIVGTDSDCKLRSPTYGVDVSADSLRHYDYSARIKTDLLAGRAYLRVRFMDEGGVTVGISDTVPVTDTQGLWIKASGTVQVPDDAAYVRLETVLGGPAQGSAWFDDVFLGLATCLDIGKSATPDPATLGGMITYTIAFSNTGRERATDVMVIEMYDKFVDFVAATPPPLAGTETVWMFPDLPAGGSDTIEVVVQVENDTQGRAWLFNDVQILSDETVRPIYATISTSVPVTGCVIDFFFLEDEKTGEPNQQVDYDLTLRNSGNCDGQVDLETFSSLGWDVAIMPSPPFNLLSGSSKDVWISPIVSRHALKDELDVTTITATLGCGLSCIPLTATATVSVSTQVTAVPLSGVEITGTTAGDAASSHTFIAAVSPITATQPITYLWRATGQNNKVAFVDAPTHTVAFSWHTSGTYTVAVAATNAGRIEHTDIHTITITGSYQDKIYLPLLARDWPPIPDSPELYPIDNPDGDGSYAVQWSAGKPGTVGTQLIPPTYDLQEATHSDFSAAVQIYSGPDTSYTVSGQGPGRYYYRVRACNNWRCSDWSNVAWVDVQ